MIKCKEELKKYLNCEKYSNFGANSLRHKILPPPSFIYLRYLRKYEYYKNSQTFKRLIWGSFYYLLLRHQSQKTGIQIPAGTCDMGLTLYHFGSIVINSACKIGKNCCIMNNVNIGANQGSHKAPQIGDNVYIGPGAVIFGDISIADGCYIGANAVVNKDITEQNSVVVGIPAKTIGIDKVHWWEKNGLKR